MAEYLSLIQDADARRERNAELVRTYYDIATSIYREGWGDSFHLTWFNGQQSLAEAQRALEHWVSEAAGLRPGMRVVDVGCGIGGPATTIAAHSGADVVGVNISPLHLDLARRRPAPSAGSAEFVEGDAQALPLPDAEFDAGYVIQAICHAPDKAGAYREMARVLRNGATFVGTDWFVREGITPDEHQTWIEPISQACMLSDLISLRDLREALTAAGFRVEEITRFQDHGDVAPNWHVPQAIAPRPYDQPGEQELFKDTLEQLGRAVEGGYLVLGCWIARKTGGRPRRLVSRGRSEK